MQHKTRAQTAEEFIYKYCCDVISAKEVENTLIPLGYESNYPKFKEVMISIGYSSDLRKVIKNNIDLIDITAENYKH